MDPINFQEAQVYLQKILTWAIPILFAVTLHEAAHGYIANKLGDDTALRMGRITANPFKHIDLIGTIILPLILILTSPFVFGWAKPVPVDARKLRHPKRDMALVALAGPLSNFLMALFWAGVLKLGILIADQNIAVGTPFILMGKAGILINFALAVLNMIPIPPLDGSRLISSVLPAPADQWYENITPFGFLIVLGLLALGILSKILTPAITWLVIAISALFQIPLQSFFLS